MPGRTLNLSDFGGEAFNLSIAPAAREVLDRVKAFIADEIDPATARYYALGERHRDRWSFAPGQLEILDDLKARAKTAGLWNLFLPDSESGRGLTNVDYAYIAHELGKSPLAPECLNCSAPDTGNMEVLERVGTPEQKAQWLQPLLDGEIRSAYAMTEPDVASSDARNIQCRADLVDREWIINGRKFFITGAGDPRCKILIVMVRTGDDPGRHSHSQILVPMQTPGVSVDEGMTVFGHDDAPRGHMHITFRDVRVPYENVLLGVGRGFEISQLRLGPGRIHHTMRAIGAAEQALELMVRRASTREAFGRPLIKLGGNLETVARARIDIESMRLMVLRAAKAMDLMSNEEASVWISAVKAMVPDKVCRIIDEAIQLHGAAGLSRWTPLADMYVAQRILKFADGPDQVHHMVVGRAEVARHTIE